METYFESFHEDDQISENSYLPTVNDMMNDQLGILESIKANEKNASEDHLKNQYSIGKLDDFQEMMSDWQQHSIETEDLGFGLGLGMDCGVDTLNIHSSNSLFEEKETSILSKALKCTIQKGTINNEPTNKLLAGNETKKELIIENFNFSENCQKLCELIKTENSLIGKVTLLNGEKEILGKNIVGLHCLNEIKENPDENCQVTSTIINGKRYKIIIKPKSLKVKKLSNEKIKKSLIKKLLQCNLVTKTEPKEDEIISEMRNGNYDVPILGSDLLPNWDLVNLDSEWNSDMGNESYGVADEPETEKLKKVSPLRIKVPKPKKNKKMNSVNKSDEEVDVETVNEKVVEGSNLTNLLRNFEQEVAKLQNEKTNNLSSENSNKMEQKLNKTTDVIKNSLPKQVIEKIETMKRKRDCRIPLIQAIPTKKGVKCCTRMQDAVAIMNRNKLLKIVSGGDTISLDHDYCSTFNKKVSCNKQTKKSNYLAEKNPKKDSGMESGDVSDTSEGPSTPETSQNTQLHNISNRLTQDPQIGKPVNEPGGPVTTDSSFRLAHSSPAKTDVDNSDSVKTDTVSNGNKVLTNIKTKIDFDSNSSVTVPTENENKNMEDSEKHCENDSKNESIVNLEKPEVAQSDRPKRKLKLEEYLSRRNVKEKGKNNNSTGDCNGLPNSTDTLNIKNDTSKLANETENNNPKDGSGYNTAQKIDEQKEGKRGRSGSREEKDKYWRERSRRSSSTSSERRRDYDGSKGFSSKSNMHCRSDSSSSSSRRHEKRGKHRSRWSTSRDRRMGCWSGSSSRSPSRESSTSSDYGRSRRSRNSSRYRRRSRSRSSSQGRPRSRNRDYSNRSSLGSYYYNQNPHRKRSRSPFYAHSMREKQRQIEERRVIYVGRIEEGMTNAKLRKRFSVFGPIIDISLHFREYGDNYGFVTYAYKADAYDAVEHGNDDPSLPHYDLCFGGRRGFCKEKYADLDGMPTSYSGFNDTPMYRGAKESFDMLLKEAQAKLKNRKKQ
ncbi:hypothetical protein RUM44_001790 [Polyplax serrata]|uniref:RRM domain-containing protein n=1 Tax=Polyplax serrata TaxID=468196 RepID=A0ABR1AL24_POLSC